MGHAIMLQGTGSSVGKSTIVAALCRIFSQEGYRVAPFKSQNMGSDTVRLGRNQEISGVQYRQALAAQVEPVVEMNPILLKPVSDLDSEVIVNGQSVGVMSAQEYIAYKPKLLEGIRDALSFLKANYDLVIIEGAGSPAEVNLRAHDLANMAVAEMAEAPVFLVADIHWGGVFAYIHGTMKLLLPRERARVQGLMINKFSGDATRFAEGADILTELTGVPVLGVIPLPKAFSFEENTDWDRLADHIRDHLDLKPFYKNLSLGGLS